MAKRKAKGNTRNIKRKQPIKKTVSKRKVFSKLKSKKISKPVKQVAKRIAKKPIRLVGKVLPEKYKRGSNELNFGFNGVKNIDKKLDQLTRSKTVKSEIEKQFKRKKGKPPKALVIIARDKKGNETGQISNPDLVINQKNIEKEIKLFVRTMKSNRKKYMKGFNREKLEGYGDIPPDNFNEFDFKFIY